MNKESVIKIDIPQRFALPDHLKLEQSRNETQVQSAPAESP